MDRVHTGLITRLPFMHEPVGRQPRSGPNWHLRSWWGGTSVVFVLLGSCADGREPFAPFDPPDTVGVAAEWTVVGEMPETSHGVAAAYFDGGIYVAGGESDDGDLRGSFRRFDLSAGAWETLDDLPAPRRDAMLIAWTDAIYLAGGLGATPTGDRVPLADFARYARDTGTWVPQPDLPFPVYQGIGGIMDSRIAVVGGRTNLNGDPPPGRGAIGFDPVVGTWAARDGLPVPLVEASGATEAGDIVVVGGRTWPSLTLVARISVRHNLVWQPIGQLPAPRVGMAVASVRGSVFTFGGVAENGTPFVGDYAGRYRAAASPHVWITYETPAFELPVRGHRAVPFGPAVYLLGGRRQSGDFNTQIIRFAPQ